jgi:hypothetical protein
MTLTPLMTSNVVPEGLEFAVAGSWTAAHSERLEQLIDGAAREAGKAQRIAMDMAGIDELDTLGAWLLERLARNFKSNGKDTQVTGLKPLYRGLTDEMRRVNLQPRMSPEHANRLLLALDRVGRAAAGLMSDISEFLDLFGEVGVAIGRIFLHPRRFRLTSAVYHVFRVGWQAVPIMALITFLARLPRPCRRRAPQCGFDDVKATGKAAGNQVGDDVPAHRVWVGARAHHGNNVRRDKPVEAIGGHGNLNETCVSKWPIFAAWLGPPVMGSFRVVAAALG